jgi:isopenicillin-N epimerase
MPSHGRRRFLTTLVGGVAATAVAPAAHGSSTLTGRSLNGLRNALVGLDTADEKYWQLVKEQFPLRPGLILMNAANLCPSPYPVIDAVSRLTGDVDADASFQNRAKFGELRETGRNLLAAYLGADPGEIAITRNTSEGNNTVINGLTLGSGDEVVIWDQNHPTNNVSWDVRAERYGFTVVRASTPPAPRSGEELVQAFAQKLNSRTRVLSFSHVSNTTGVGVPAKELCSMARDRGVLTLVDGAQTFGAVRVDVHDIGCDFYTGSSHKWFVGPKEAGLLYVRRDQVADLWPSNVGVGWEGALEKGAQKFDNLGQRDDAAVAAMGTAAEFHQTIGIEVVDARVRALAARMKDAVSERFPEVRFVTPLDPRLSAGVVIFALPGVAARNLFEALYREQHIGCTAMGEGLRFSPHIYNTMEEVDRVVEAIAREMGPK